MRFKTHFSVLTIALLGLYSIFSVVAYPQQNVSGGSTTTITQGGNTAIVSAAGALKTDATILNASIPVTGTFFQSVQPVSQSGTFTVGINTAIPAGTNLIGKVNIIPLDACGGTNYDSGLVTLPTTTTALTATATCVQMMGFNNTTSSQQTITVTDGQGTPQPVFSSFVIQPNSQVVVRFDGVRFIGGVKWSSVNASAVVGWVKGDQ